MGASAGSEQRHSIGDINTTPLIDVLLVLLIMFIITIPIQTHAVKVDVPTRDRSVVVDRLKNKLVIEAEGTLLWNGDRVDRDKLRQYLHVLAGMDPAPELHLQPHPEARYEVVDEVIAMIKRADVETMGFVGNEAYADF